MLIVDPDKGLHPLDERYIEAFAFRGDLDVAGYGTPLLRCPLCLGELVPTHRQRHGRRYFRHRVNADAVRCPLTTANYQPEEFVVRAPLWEPLIADTNRSRFLFSWKRHYRIARYVAPSLTLERFTGLIEYADVRNLWSHRQLDQRDLPYVLLVLAGFMAVRRKGEGTTWVRFWFDGRVRDAGDLWRPGVPAAQVFRVIYRDPVQTPFPTGAEVVRWERVERIDRLADVSGPDVSRADIHAFDVFRMRNASTWRAQRDDGNG